MDARRSQIHMKVTPEAFQTWSQRPDMEVPGMFTRASQPAHFCRSATGHRRSPYTLHLGPTCRRRSCTEFQPLEIHNPLVLQDHQAHEVPPHPAQQALTLARTQAHPGHASLLPYPQLFVDARRVYTDLSTTLLTHYKQMSLIQPLLPYALPARDGQLWWVECFGEVRPAVGEQPACARTEFEQLQEESALQVVGAASPMTSEVRQWQTYQQAGKKLGRGSVGLPGQTAAQGKRTARIEPGSLHVIAAALQTYNAKQPA